MTTITLHNTKTRTKEAFTPIDAENVRMYVCGPTVYDRAHLGNARPVIVFDVLYRLLRHVYGADHVTYVRNFTDVDDKINATALARQEAGASGTLEELIRERTEETIDWYRKDMGALGALEPTHAPRATEFIDEMQDMISELIHDRFAYTAASTIGHNSKAKYVYADADALSEICHAFLSVDKFNEPGSELSYGDLSGRSVDDMIAGSRAEVGEGKRNPMDSVLWKPSTIEQPGWNSPWGRGRPGWHIECSAMSRKLLGKRFDIHGGGLDLLFPHHENELAQCQACDGPDSSAQYWLHNEMLQVEGKKMSKSLGNFFTVRDLLEQGVPGEVIRFVLLSTHYRKPMDWTEKKRVEAEKTLRKWRDQTRGVIPEKPDDLLVQTVANDLNTAGAIAELHGFSAAGDVSSLLSSAQFLGLLTDDLSGWETTSGIDGADLVVLQKFETQLASMRDKAMKTKNFSPLDELKGKLIAAGVKVGMPKGGVELTPTDDFDPTKLWAIERNREAEA